MKILMADDSKAVMERLDSMLKELPAIEVLHAPNPSSALRLAGESMPSAVILDPHFARAGAIQCVKDIRRQDPQATLIVFTSHVSFPYRQRCLAAGADLFFDKAADFEALLAVIGHLAEAPAAGQQDPLGQRDPESAPEKSPAPAPQVSQGPTPDETLRSNSE